MDKNMIGIALMVIGLNIAAAGGYCLFEYMVLSSNPVSDLEFDPLSGLRTVFLVFGIIGLVVGLAMVFLGANFYLEGERESKLRKDMYRQQFPSRYDRDYRRPPQMP